MSRTFTFCFSVIVGALLIGGCDLNTQRAALVPMHSLKPN